VNCSVTGRMRTMGWTVVTGARRMWLPTALAPASCSKPWCTGRDCSRLPAGGRDFYISDKIGVVRIYRTMVYDMGLGKSSWMTAFKMKMLSMLNGLRREIFGKQGVFNSSFPMTFKDL
jgi:hypothetical protein